MTCLSQETVFMTVFLERETVITESLQNLYESELISVIHENKWNIGQIKLKEQLHKAIFQNEETLLKEVQFSHAKKQYNGEDDAVINDQNIETIDWKSEKYFVLNTPGSSFADVFLMHLIQLIKQVLVIICLHFWSSNI